MRVPPFGKLLIANRGEVAVRVIRACRELGIASVAVYSEADRGAMHVRLADEAYPIGPAPAPESYLKVENLIGAALRSGAEAVHPGYGFLSENAPFARAVLGAGLAWVGPPPEAMERVGDKVRAKELAQEAGVPTVPGYAGEDGSEERLLEEAGKIGFPVLVKASAGGGGRGMRPVHDRKGFLEAVRGARREAEAAFGEGAVFLEKLVERPRHVEVQVLADGHGNVVHLYERECSIQRRHQKVVEEAPSPALSEDLRGRMGDAAVRLTRAAGYENAGTVEFLVQRGEAGDEFFFLEMNARLQVEHPVTEGVTGLDLVHLQLAVAAGEPLPFLQEGITLRGAAIEARIYAEDPYTGLPSGGTLRRFAPPVGPGIRVDAGVEGGDDVSLSYDPMLAKLIVSGPDRGAAVARLRRALDDFSILGPTTNLPLLRRVAREPAFVAGETTTAFFEEHGLLEEPAQKSAPPPREALLLAAAAELSRVAPAADPFAAGPWRHLGAARLRYKAADGEEREVRARREGALLWRLEIGDEASVVEVLSLRDGDLRAEVDGRFVGAGFAEEGSEVLVSLGGEEHRLERPAPPDADGAGGGTAGEGASSLVAPMPGTVVRVMASEGDEVEEGQPLLVLEAMKMEQTVAAPYAGTVTSLPYAEGALVPGGAVLAEVEASGG